ncbi:hypothetical protein TNCV_3278361 [Trichonephila clavipes]|nr:hypothetical protein TNCV_3278361 [Trichonephila clavipes]
MIKVTANDRRHLPFSMNNSVGLDLEFADQFIKRTGIIPEGDIFQISPKEKSRIDKSEERGGQSPLEMTRSLKD